VAALFDVASQSCCAADLDGMQRAQLMKRQAMRAAVRGAMPANNVGQLQR
jgi:hypothetical protein